MADELVHVVEQASTPTVCLGALHAPEPKVLAANALRHLWMLPPHRSARGLTAQFEIVQRGAQFEQGGALAAGQFEGGGDVAGAGVEVHYRLDRTLAPREGFVNDSLITTLPAIRNRIHELRRHAARSLAESSTRDRHSQTPRWRSKGSRLSSTKGRHSTCDGRSSTYPSRAVSVTGCDPQAPSTLWIVIIRQHRRNRMLHSAYCLELVLLVTLRRYVIHSALGNHHTNQTRRNDATTATVVDLPRQLRRGRQGHSPSRRSVPSPQGASHKPGPGTGPPRRRLAGPAPVHSRLRSHRTRRGRAP